MGREGKSEIDLKTCNIICVISPSKIVSCTRASMGQPPILSRFDFAGRVGQRMGKEIKYIPVN